MRLKNVTLNNFRRFESLKVDLHPRLTVFVGENGAGKTAILDGIAASLLPVLRHLSSPNQRLSSPGSGIKDTDFRIESWAARNGKEKFGVTDYSQVISETTTGLKWDYWRPSSKGGGPDEKIGETALSSYLSKVIDSLKTPTPKLLPVFAYYGAQRGRIDVPGRIRISKENYDHPTSALLDSLDSVTNFREMLQWFDIEESNELRANKGTTPENYLESPSLVSVRTAIESLMGGTFFNPHFNKDHKFVLEPVAGGAPLQVSQLSQGYQSMLALAMDLARRLALANPHLSYNDQSSLEDALQELIKLGSTPQDQENLPKSPAMIAPSIVLIDEIDVHLHPSWQQRVITDLMKTFPSTQFIVTTHSPQILTTVPSECIRILEDGKLFSAPPGSEGAEPSRMLRQVLGLTDVRPMSNSATQELREYLALVDEDQWGSARAIELRTKLDQRYQGNEPELLEADLIIDNKKWELGV